MISRQAISIKKRALRLLSVMIRALKVILDISGRQKDLESGEKYLTVYE